jgi:Bacterial extracellular solute-binding protein, family 7
VAAMLTALGATPVDPPGDEFASGVADGTITAADSGFAIALGSTPRPGTATGNLVLYAKVITLVANDAFWDGLTDTQRDALNTAADKTRDWAIANQIDDNAAAADYCADGGTVVLTQPENVAQFRAVAAPMYAELERDATTKQVISAIDELAPTSPSTAIAACGPATSAVPTEVVANGGDLPNGVYRVEYTQEYLKAHGQNDRDASNNYGVWTYRLEDGHWSLERVAATNCCGPEDSQAGIYQVDGDQLYWKMGGPNDAALDPVHLSWSADDDGTLHFTDLSTPDSPDFAFDLPWPRIADL